MTFALSGRLQCRGVWELSPESQSDSRVWSSLQVGPANSEAMTGPGSEEGHHIPLSILSISNKDKHSRAGLAAKLLIVCVSIQEEPQTENSFCWKIWKESQSSFSQASRSDAELWSQHRTADEFSQTTFCTKPGLPLVSHHKENRSVLTSRKWSYCIKMYSGIVSILGKDREKK